MYIDEDRSPFSPFSNQATGFRAFVRAFCFLGLGAVTLVFLVLYALKLGTLSALPWLYLAITFSLFAVAAAEVISSAVKDLRSLKPRGPYPVFLFLAMLMTASFLDEAYDWAAVSALPAIGIFVWIYKTDPFFRNAAVDEDEEGSFVYSSRPRSPLSERRSAKRKRRKNRIRR